MPSPLALAEVPDGRYVLDLTPSRSFHSVLTLRLPPSPSPPPPPATSCSLQALFAFAPELILDPYQLPSDVRIQYYGHGELELPAVKADRLGTGLLAQLDSLAAAGKRELAVKLDGRYLLSAEEGEADSRSVEIGLPWVGWVCDAAAAAAAGSGAVGASYVPPSPFPSDLLSNTTLFPLKPHEGQPPLVLTLPVGRASDLPLVELTTALAIWICAGWVAWSAWKALGSDVTAEEKR